MKLISCQGLQKNQTQMYNFYGDYKNFGLGIHKLDLTANKEVYILYLK